MEICDSFRPFIFSSPASQKKTSTRFSCRAGNCPPGGSVAIRLCFRIMVDLIERICVMQEQEARFYTTKDYLAPEFQEKLSPLSEVDDLLTHSTGASARSAASSSSSGSSSCSSGINETWREKICEWSYQVIDHFDFSREIVSVSISYLDRYLATRAVNKKTFQLAAMTSLFIAIKLYEPGKLSIPSMIELSRGYFTVEQMAAMEVSILRCVHCDWSSSAHPSWPIIFRGGASTVDVGVACAWEKRISALCLRVACELRGPIINFVPACCLGCPHRCWKVLVGHRFRSRLQCKRRSKIFGVN